MHPIKGCTLFFDSPCFFIVGALVGFFSTDVLVVPRLFCSDGTPQLHDLSRTQTPGGRLPFCTDRNLVFVGVMTSKEFLAGRAAAAYNTWGGKNFPGKVVFFAPEDAADDVDHPPGMDVVALKGVDDVYPPQKKAFLMLKYMHDRYLDKYRFFMRVDDDSFIRGDELVEFLHSVKTDRLVIGSAGWGQPKDVGKLGLRHDENYCQGGPGMIVPREVLRLTGPKIKLCVKDMYSAHEDVELGRCFKRLANASCTLAYEKPFYQNYRDYKGNFNHSLDDDDGIAESITLHPVKVPTYAYRLYRHFLTLKSTKLYGRLQRLARDMRAMRNLLLAKSRREFFNVFETYSCSSRSRRSADDVCPWVFVSDDRYSPYVSNPKLRKLQDERIAENATLKQILGVISNPRQLRNEVKPKDIKLLYSRLVQLQGLDYIFTLPKTIWNTSLKDAKGFSQLYAHRAFLPTEMIVEGKLAVTSGPYNEITVSKVGNVRVNVIVALVGRYPTYLAFMKTFEDRILKTNENVSLLLVVFRDARNDAADKVISDIDVLGRKYRDTPLSAMLVEGGLSREEAVRSAIVQSFKDDDLLFLADVEMDFDASTLQRIRLNTKLGERVYMPISFSEFNPDSLSETQESSQKNRAVRAFDRDAGYWPRYSFRTVSCYKRDFLRSEDLKLDAKEMGGDDADVPEKLFMSEIDIFRSADVGLTQRYNPAPCKTSINKTQRDTCFATISSTETLADYVYRIPAILNRGGSTR